MTFHKKDRDPALALARQIQAKGYKVFLQPMVALSYTDQEYLDLIEKANALGPYAFYLVDSFGTMKRKEMLRFFYMLEHNLDPPFTLGFTATTICSWPTPTLKPWRTCPPAAPC